MNSFRSATSIPCATPEVCRISARFPDSSMRAAFRQEYRNIPLPLRAQKSSWLVGNAEDGQVSPPFLMLLDLDRNSVKPFRAVQQPSNNASDESLTSPRENSVRY